MNPKRFPIFPGVSTSEGEVTTWDGSQPLYRFIFRSLVRIYREGKWYDLFQCEEYLTELLDLKVNPDMKEELKQRFMEKCVLTLTLWQANGELTGRYLSPNQEHHDRAVAEMFKIKQENEKV